MKRNYKYTLEEQAEKLYNRMFSHRYSGNDNVFRDFKIYRSFSKHTSVLLIKNLLVKGADVRTGWTKTRIRGVRNYYIFEGGFAD